MGRGTAVGEPFGEAAQREDSTNGTRGRYSKGEGKSVILSGLPRQEEAAHTGRIEEPDRAGVDTHRSDPGGGDGSSDSVANPLLDGKTDLAREGDDDGVRDAIDRDGQLLIDLHPLVAFVTRSAAVSGVACIAHLPKVAWGQPWSRAGVPHL